DSEVGENGHPGGEGGPGSCTVDALVEVGHPPSTTDADLDDASAPTRGSDAHRDLVDELFGQVFDTGPGEERQRRIPADEAGAGDDVHPGLGREGAVVVDVAAVADAGRVDERAAAEFVEPAQFRDGLLVG